MSNPTFEREDVRLSPVAGTSNRAQPPLPRPLDGALIAEPTANGAMNAREEIIALLRGQLSCPVISCLSELGWLERMLAGGTFDHASFGESMNVSMFHAVMRYLCALQILQPAASGYHVTTLGSKVLRRAGAFCILNSYEAHMHQLRSLLQPDGTPPPQVCRKRNVLGSGAMHGRKFFEPALGLLQDAQFDVVTDVGCGDGEFLSRCAEQFRGAHFFGVDLSEVAVDETLGRFRRNGTQAAISGIVANGADVHAWAHRSRPLVPEGRGLISLWFLLHEISQHQTDVVVEFLATLRRLRGDATLLVGEVVQHAPETLARHRSTSVLPELTLLHELSGQGLLTWAQWQEVADRIPYRIEDQLLLDGVQLGTGDLAPSNFIWKLVPRW